MTDIIFLIFMIVMWVAIFFLSAILYPIYQDACLILSGFASFAFVVLLIGILRDKINKLKK